MKTRAVTATMLLAIACMAIGLVGCAHNRPSEKPPIHLNTNMDDQPRYKPQAENRFFDDGAAMRMPVEGTVARGTIRSDSAYFAGKTKGGRLVEHNPVPITMELLERGRNRYDIFCAPCHGLTGEGNGTVIQRGMIAPPSFHEQRLVDTADGHIYEVIANGLRNMPAYKYQIPVKDRWAIVAYFRALQRSHRATIDDIPADHRQAVQ